MSTPGALIALNLFPRFIHFSAFFYYSHSVVHKRGFNMKFLFCVTSRWPHFSYSGDWSLKVLQHNSVLFGNVRAEQRAVISNRGTTGTMMAIWLPWHKWGANRQQRLVRRKRPTCQWRGRSIKLIIFHIKYRPFHSWRFRTMTTVDDDWQVRTYTITFSELRVKSWNDNNTPSVRGGRGPIVTEGEWTRYFCDTVPTVQLVRLWKDTLTRWWWTMAYEALTTGPQVLFPRTGYFVCFDYLLSGKQKLLFGKGRRTFSSIDEDVIMGMIPSWYLKRVN